MARIHVSEIENKRNTRHETGARVPQFERKKNQNRDKMVFPRTVFIDRLL